LGLVLLAFSRRGRKQWVETNTPNIHFFPTDICFYLASWYYANGLRMSVYRCSRMLDGLVSSHPVKRVLTGEVAAVVVTVAPERLGDAAAVRAGRRRAIELVLGAVVNVVKLFLRQTNTLAYFRAMSMTKYIFLTFTQV